MERPGHHFFFAAFLAGFLDFGAAFLATVFLGADLGDFLAMMYGYFC
jgi:hypothetical protein